MAVPDAVNVCVAPGARLVIVPIVPSMSSVTITSIGTFPQFVTMYSQFTGSPTSIFGPVGLSASSPFVCFSMSTHMLTPK